MDPIKKYLVRGIEVSGFEDISHFIDYLFAHGHIKTGTLVAINAEKVITAGQDKSLKQMIEAAEYKYADGISITRAIRRKYPQVKMTRIAGADLWEALMIKAGQENIPVFLVGGKTTVLMETVAKLRQQWQVNIVGCQNGFFKAEEHEVLFAQIRASGAKIVTVAMGSPKQELFIRDCREVVPNVLFMGVGGTYDVFTGHVKRAPKLWQRWGLEWLYRLLTQPTRWRRQINLLKFLSYYYTGRL